MLSPHNTVQPLYRHLEDIVQSKILIKSQYYVVHKLAFANHLYHLLKLLSLLCRHCVCRRTLYTETLSISITEIVCYYYYY